MDEGDFWKAMVILSLFLSMVLMFAASTKIQNLERELSVINEVSYKADMALQGRVEALEANKLPEYLELSPGQMRELAAVLEARARPYNAYCLATTEGEYVSLVCKGNPAK